MATNPYQDTLDKLSTGSQVAPVTSAFDESKGVAGRVDSIIGKDSPLMQRASTRANQQMNARGLTNSSMAVGAGQAAVMDAATPIANADAGLFQQQQLANQQATNQGNQFNSAARTNIGLEGIKVGESGRQFDTGLAENTRQFGESLGMDKAKLAEGTRQFDTSAGMEKQKIDQNASQFGQSLMEQARQFNSGAATEQQKLAQQQAQFTANAENQKALAEMDAANRIELAGVEAKYKTAIAGNENISRAWGTTMTDIAQIQNNPDLDDDTKTALIQNTLNGFQSFTNFWQKATGGTVNVQDLLNFQVGSTGGDGGSRENAPNVPQPREGFNEGGEFVNGTDR